MTRRVGPLGSRERWISLMCGIAGFIKAESIAEDDRRALQSMLARLRHRGPDGGGQLEGERLVMRWLPYNRNIEKLDWSGQDGEILTENLEEFTLGYRPSYEEDWVDSWENSQSIPVAVRLNLKSRGRYWPELVVRLDSGKLNLR